MSGNIAQRVVTIADRDVQAVVFMRGDGSAEVVLTHPEKPGKPTKIEVPKPPEGMRIVLTRYPTGEMEVMYRSEI
jgi:hypothetical protein